MLVEGTLLPAAKEGKLKRHRLADAIKELEASATEAVDSTVKNMRHQGVDDIVSLGVGEPCFDTPDNIKEAAVKALMDGETKYQPTAGTFQLREAICRKLERENNIQTDPENVVVTAGGKFAIYLAFTAMLQEGDKVVLLDPAWVSYEAAAQMNGAKVKRVPSSAIDGFTPDLDRIESLMDNSVKIVVVNSPCNPSGAVLSESCLRQLSRIADKHGALIISDEVYDYQIYGQAHYSPASEFENIITINSFSKSYAMTGWRLGYSVAPADIVKGMIKIYSHSTSSVTSFAQWGGIEALESETSAAEVKKMQIAYTKNRSLMIELIKKSAYLDLACEPEGAFYCFPSYRFDMGSIEMASRLLKGCHVAVVPGLAFGRCGEGFLRLSYATESKDIEEAMGRMESFFQSLERESG